MRKALATPFFVTNVNTVDNRRLSVHDNAHLSGSRDMRYRVGFAMPESA
jgi:hypothetical protein